MDITHLYDAEGRIVKRIKVEEYTLETLSQLLVALEARQASEEAELEAIKERIRTQWKDAFLDADYHGHDPKSPMMLDWYRGRVLNYNHIYQNGNINGVKTTILELCRKQFAEK